MQEAGSQYARYKLSLLKKLSQSTKSTQIKERATKWDHKKWCYEHHKTKGKSLKALTSLIDEKVFVFLRQLRGIIDNDETDSRKLDLIKDFLETNKTGFPEIEQQWNDFKRGFDAGTDDPEYYDILEKRSLRLQNRFIPILKALDFQCESGIQPLADALEYFRKINGAIRHNAPIDFLENAERKLVSANGLFRSSLYKTLLFTHVAGAIKSSQLNLEHSYKYRSLDEYLVSRVRWDTEKKELLHGAERPLKIINLFSDSLNKLFPSNISPPMTISAIMQIPIFHTLPFCPTAGNIINCQCAHCIFIGIPALETKVYQRPDR